MKFQFPLLIEYVFGNIMGNKTGLRSYLGDGLQPASL